jgi:hypothetical protein
LVTCCVGTEGKVEGDIEVARRQRRRSRQVLDKLKKMRGYWILKEGALDRTVWRTPYGRCYGPLLRQTE